MNEVRRLGRNAEAIATAREIVNRHRGTVPDFITGFDVKLGHSDGDPALFVLYKVVEEDAGRLHEDWVARAEAYRKLDDTVLPELVEALDDCYPYSFRAPDWRWSTYPD